MFYKIVRPFCMAFYKLFYRVKVFNKEKIIKKGKCIVVCNHLGKADVMVVGALYPDKTIFLSKIEWYKNKLLGWLLKKMGTIPVDRDKPSLTSIREALKTLKEDKRLGIFPEGTRNKNSTEILEIKEGTAMFAVKGKAVITPVIIYDRLKMFKRNYAIVGNPIDLSEFYDERFTEEISKKCSKIIRDKMVELQMELFAKVEELKK